jgi:hypothetical protein
VCALTTLARSHASPTQGKRPKPITTALPKRYSPNGEKLNADKYSQLPSTPKIKSYTVRAREFVIEGWGLG